MSETQVTEQPARTGGQILVDQLLLHGVDSIYGVPGESYLGALEALRGARNAIRFITCRQEGGAANMADAYGKLTGKPGICFVTRGPGATNASIGVHTAFQDSTPMILFVGQVARDQQEREAFQEVDYRQMFGPLAKWVVQIEDARRIPELVSQAFHRAVSGRPGPVVVALPEDMLTDRVAAADARPYAVVRPAPAAADIERLEAMLKAAAGPILILGGGGWTSQACDGMRRFAERNGLPVATSFRNADLIDNRHPNYVGDVGVGINPPLRAYVERSDLVLAVGPRLGEMTSGGYTLFGIPAPRQPVVHVHGGADELGRVYRAELMINSGMANFAAAVDAITVAQRRWSDATADLRAAYLQTLLPVPSLGDVNLSEIVAWLNRRLPDDAVVANGAGNYSGWVHRFFQYRGLRSQLAPTSGAMGYGVPAAVAAKLQDPRRTVVAFAGDGCFLMNGQEFATAVQFGADIVVVVVDNGQYGTIRMHQEREYGPDHDHGVMLRNPDFAAYAHAFGGHGETVTGTAQFEPAFERALAARKPAIIHVRTSLDQITPRLTLAQAGATNTGRA